MIGKLRGSYAGGSTEAAIIDVGGVGYLVRLPLATLSSMRSTPQEVSIYIHTAVREDAIDLYGFSTEEELAFFKQLIDVSGIGPKSALGILNIADVGTLKRGIARGDASILTKVFGIGKKSAERIVVELRDKLALESSAKGEVLGSGEDGEVIEALMALGYSADESRKALKQIDGVLTGVRERLSAALKYLGSKS
jgi:Holliday junction DNA helicase RuvA